MRESRSSVSVGTEVGADRSGMGARDRFLELVGVRDRRGALDLAAGLMAAGMDITELVSILSSVQVEIGRLWETGSGSIAKEHASTAIVESVIAAAAASTNLVPQRGRVVVACVEDEWHSLPARMFSEVVAAAGYEVTFLGPSLPPEDVGAFLRQVDPIGVALSCSVAMNLPGAARVIDAAHAAGSRTLVGGSGFGLTPARATSIGADAWAGSPADALDVLDAWSRSPGPVRPSERALGGEAPVLLEQRDVLVRRAVEALTARLTGTITLDQQQAARTRADYLYIVRFLESALLVGDDSIFLEFLPWLGAVQPGTALPAAVLPLLLNCLGSALPEGLTQSARLLAEGNSILTRAV